jgi:hypothetical protein
MLVMDPKHLDAPRPVSGAYPRASSPADACTIGLARALRALSAAQVTASALADDLASTSEAYDGAAAEAHRRMSADVRRLQRHLALAVSDLLTEPE